MNPQSRQAASRLERPGCALSGAVAIVVSVLMAVVVEFGWTQSWPDEIQDGWGLYATVGLVGGALLLGAGLGILNRSHLRDEPSLTEREVGARDRLAIYVGGSAVLLAVALVLSSFGIPWQKTLFAGYAIAMIVGSTKHPWWLFQAIREFGILAPLADRVVRVLILGFGILLLALGALGG